MANDQTSGEKPETTAGAAKEPPVEKSGRSKKILLGLLTAGVVFGAYEGFGWWTHGRFFEETDDAYVSADITTVLSKVSGYVSEIAVSDNQSVAAGEVLLKIDDGDYRLAVTSAEDALGSAKAAVERISDQIAAGEASVRQAEAGLRAAEAAKEDADLTFERQQRLTKSSVASQASLDTARTTRMSQAANVDKAKAAVELAKANVAVLQSQKKEAIQSVHSAETALDKALRDLDFTIVRAPVDGILGNRAAQVGSFLQAGSRVAAIVPIRDAHIDANFKETQLGHIRPGATVSISIDAYPDEVLEGQVESISPATGSVFSLLPSENATGNFTKVVQRVPVRIQVDPADLQTHPLRAGMSVVVEVDTRTGTDDQATAAVARN